MENHTNEFNNVRITFFDFIKCFSSALDLILPKMSGHHMRVAYIVYRLALEYKLPKSRMTKLVLGACMHDIGAITVEERNKIINEDYESDFVHEKIGGSYLSKSALFKEFAIYARHHHMDWNYGNNKYINGVLLPVECHLLHLADRIDSYINKEEFVLYQVPHIIEKVKTNSGILFMPEAVNVFLKVCDHEDFWLYTVSSSINDIIEEIVGDIDFSLDIKKIRDLTKWFSNIIDFRSRFTSVHSRGVSATAVMLGKLLNLNEIEITKLEIAGYIHDLGKLAVPNAILEKNGKLDPDEFAVIRSHTFHTYNILIRLPGFKEIVEYGAFHHEHLDGSGYPFHLKGAKLSVGARILAVADVFTAITEDRPYRVGMDRDSTIDVLNNMKKEKLLDPVIVNVAITNIDKIGEYRKEKQKEAANEYIEFWDVTSKT